MRLGSKAVAVALPPAAQADASPRRPPLTSVSRLALYSADLQASDAFHAMELHAIGRPCCSPFTAPDPQR